jgi:hypothetical protein
MLEANQIPIPATGTLTLFVSDCSTVYTGTYVLYAERINSPAGASNLL